MAKNKVLVAWRVPLFSVVFLLALAFWAVGVDLSSCGVISSPGNYSLSSDVSAQAGCFAITSSNVQLDCGLHLITYGSADVQSKVASDYPAARITACQNASSVSCGYYSRPIKIGRTVSSQALWANWSWYQAPTASNATRDYNGPILSMHLEGDVNDSSSENLPAQVVGNTTSAMVRTGCKVGSCLAFDGVDDYVNLSQSLEFPGATPFSISLWFNPSSLSKAGILLSKYDYAVFGQWSLQIASNNSILFHREIPPYLLYSTTPVHAYWNHVVVTFNGTHKEIYLDGLQASSIVENGPIPDVPSSIVRSDTLIGAIKSNSVLEGFFDGMMDEVHVWKRGLSGSEVLALYNLESQGKFDHSTTNVSVQLRAKDFGFSDSGLMGWWDLGDEAQASLPVNTSKDLSGNGFDAVFGNATLGTQPGVNSVGCKFGKCLDFDGSGKFVLAGNATGLLNASLTNSFAVTAWVKPRGNVSNVMGGIIVNNEGQYEIMRMENGSILYAVSNAFPGWFYTYTNLTLPLNRWGFIAFAYSNETGVVTVFNGTDFYNYVGSGNINDTHPGYDNVRIGERENQSAPFNGSIDDVKIWNRSLSQSEIGELYSDPVPKSKVGLVGWWNLGDEGGMSNNPVATSPDLSGNNNDGQFGNTADGSMPLLSTNNCVIGRCMRFDGSSSVVVIPDSSSTRPLNGLTVAAWVNYDQIFQDSAGHAIISKSDGTQGPPTDGFMIYQATQPPFNRIRAFVLTLGTSAVGNSQTLLDTGKWYHVALAYNGTAVVLFVNGKVDSVFPASGGVKWNAVVPQLLIGSTYASHLTKFKGYIDDVKLWNRGLGLQEIAALYNAGNPTNSTGQERNWTAWTALQQYNASSPNGNTSLPAISGKILQYRAMSNSTTAGILDYNYPAVLRGLQVGVSGGNESASGFLSGDNVGVFASNLDNVSVTNCRLTQQYASAKGAAAIVFVNSTNTSAVFNTISTAASWDGVSALSGAHGIVVSGRGSKASLLTKNTITINGDGSHAIFLHDGPSQVSVKPNAVNVTGKNAAGIAASLAGNSTIFGNSVYVFGSFSSGILVSEPAPMFTVASNTVFTNADYSDALSILRSTAQNVSVYGNNLQLNTSTSCWTAQVYNSSGLRLESNTIAASGNLSIGLAVLLSQDCVFTKNTISSGVYAVYAFYSNNLTFSDEHLNSVNNSAVAVRSSVDNKFYRETVNFQSAVPGFTLWARSSAELADVTFGSGNPISCYSGSINNYSLLSSVSAIVKDATGAPLGGVGVNLTWRNNSLIDSQLTDANGLTSPVYLPYFKGNSTVNSSFNPFRLSMHKFAFKQLLGEFNVTGSFQQMNLVLEANNRPASTAGSLFVALPLLGVVNEYAPNGSLLWSFEGSPVAFNSPQDAVAFGDGVLVSDYGNQRVALFNPNGTAVWQYGVAGVRGSGFNLLDAPRSAMPTGGGRVLISDFGNVRLLEVDSLGNVVWNASTSRQPVLAVKNGATVLASFSDGAIGELNYSTHQLLWLYNSASPGVRAYPLSTGNVLVVDPAHGTLYEVSRIIPTGGTVIWSASLGGIRDAVELADGSIVAVNTSALLRLSQDRRSFTQIASLPAIPSSVRPSSGAFFQSQQVVARGAKTFFVVDRGTRRVVELDESLSNMVWQYGTGLSSPVAVASAFNGERLFVADSGLKKVIGVFYSNGSVFVQLIVAGMPTDVKWAFDDKLLITDSVSGVVNLVNFTSAATMWSFGAGILNTPLSATPLRDGSILIADTGNNRILKVLADGSYTDLKPNATSLSQPSRAVMLANGNILVADTGNARVIEYTLAGTVVRSIVSGMFSAPYSVLPVSSDEFLVVDQGFNTVGMINQSSNFTRKYSLLNTPTDAVVGFDQSYYYSIFTTYIGSSDALALSKSVPTLFSLILSKGSIGAVDTSGTLSPLWTPFASVGGLQSSSCADGDAQCCSRSWCSQNALSQLTSTLKAKAMALANSTAFRRGEDRPFRDVGGLYFTYVAVAQLAQGVNLSAAGWTCTNCSGPGVFKLSVRASSNASTPLLSSTPMQLSVANAIDGGQPASVVLLGFIYSNASAIAASSTPNLLSANQLANQSMSTVSCSWTRPACVATRQDCCMNATDGSGACTAFRYTFAPSSATISPVGADCGSLSIPVSCNPNMFCGETNSTLLCTAVPATVSFKVLNATVVRVLQDGLSITCDPIPAPNSPVFAADSLADQLSTFVNTPYCVVNATGQCPALPITAAFDQTMLTSIRIGRGS